MSIRLVAAKLENLNYFFYLRERNSNKKSFIKNESFNLNKHKIWFKKALKNTKHKV